MNKKLVDSLIQIINSLTPEEKALLEEKLKANKILDNWQEEYQKLVTLREEIFKRRDGKSLEPNPEEVIHQMREERIEQLMQATHLE